MDFNRNRYHNHFQLLMASLSKKKGTELISTSDISVHPHFVIYIRCFVFDVRCFRISLFPVIYSEFRIARISRFHQDCFEREPRPTTVAQQTPSPGSHNCPACARAHGRASERFAPIDARVSETRINRNLKGSSVQRPQQQGRQEPSFASSAR